MTIVQMQRAAEEQGRARLEEFTSGLEAKMQRYRLVFVMSIPTLLQPVRGCSHITSAKMGGS